MVDDGTGFAILDWNRIRSSHAIGGAEFFLHGLGRGLRLVSGLGEETEIM